LRLPGRKFLQALARPVRKVWFPGAVILGYHRIADLEWDPLNIAVGIENFRDQLKILGRSRQVVSLGELIRLQETGQPMERYAALTFDDGYGDFLEIACPLLTDTRLPSTVFIATSFTGRAFWWEKVAELMEPRQARDESLVVDFGAGDRQIFSGLEDAEAATLATRTICHRLKGGDRMQISNVLEQIGSWAGIRDSNDVVGRPLTADEIALLFADEWVEVGAHTVSHGCLGDMAPGDQQMEIERSRVALESITGGAVSTFSYPNGSYSEETPEIVRQAGFECACTSRQATFRSGGNRFLIPRVWVPDAGGQAFEEWLSQWIRIKS
jgi:peptidoglycan/xylan/chitin deacetylase (PgdA/CDA1 family)